jgi:hypothetical protein
MAGKQYGRKKQENNILWKLQGNLWHLLKDVRKILEIILET